MNAKTGGKPLPSCIPLMLLSMAYLQLQAGGRRQPVSCTVACGHSHSSLSRGNEWV